LGGKKLREVSAQNTQPDSEFFWARIANPPASVKRKSRPQHQKLGIVFGCRGAGGLGVNMIQINDADKKTIVFRIAEYPYFAADAE